MSINSLSIVCCVRQKDYACSDYPCRRRRRPHLAASIAASFTTLASSAPEKPEVDRATSSSPANKPSRILTFLQCTFTMRSTRTPVHRRRKGSKSAEYICLGGYNDREAGVAKVVVPPHANPYRILTLSQCTLSVCSTFTPVYVCRLYFEVYTTNKRG